MPVYSMTGYASAQHSTAKTSSETESKNPSTMQLGMEIRAVNSRFLDLSFKLPEDLRQFEPALRELLTGQLKRGKVELRVSVENNAALSITEPSPKLLQRLNSTQDTIRSWLPQTTPLSVADILRLASQEQPSTQNWGEALLPLAQKVVKDLLSARQREGTRLCTMLRGHLTQLRALTEKAAPLVPLVVEQQRKRFLERWQDAMASAGGAILPETAQERALSEATAFAIRIDIAEELTRLQSHLDEIERLLKKGSEIGKRLDFLIQELHREANTLGSKASALELTHISVDMKVLIEQMREQVQNIE
jgi:uncharacterized protein (TIGR00255 family)